MKIDPKFITVENTPGHAGYLDLFVNDIHIGTDLHQTICDRVLQINDLRIEFAVEFWNHDRSSAGGRFIRPTPELARRSAGLMKECGYQETRVRAFLLKNTPLESETLGRLCATIEAFGDFCCCEVPATI